jgi:hypothetical protein
VGDVIEASGGSVPPSTPKTVPALQPAPALHGSHARASSSLEATIEIVAAAPNEDSVRQIWAAEAAFVAEKETVRQHHIPRADLLQRVFEIGALHCPKCGGRMRVLSAITDPVVAGRMLRCLGLPPRAPPLAAAGDGASRSHFIGHEILDEAPEFDFDQSSRTEYREEET